MDPGVEQKASGMARLPSPWLLGPTAADFVIQVELDTQVESEDLADESLRQNLFGFGEVFAIAVIFSDGDHSACRNGGQNSLGRLRSGRYRLLRPSMLAGPHGPPPDGSV